MNLSEATMEERPFAATNEKYNTEHASSKVTVSNFPYHEIQSLPGYTEREWPGLMASEDARDLARYLAEYAVREGCPIPYEEYEIGGCLYGYALALHNCSSATLSF